jgi:hydroxymethylbilane synthase
MADKIVLGTRGSELARTQAHLVEKALQTVRPDVIIEMKIIATKGDKTKVVDLLAGRKGLFTAEIERALLSGDVDVAVHSAKDLPSETSPGAEIAAVLPRGSVDDVIVSKFRGGLAGLPEGAMIGTGSVRRKYQLRWKRPDLKIVDVRGNVPTRLRKLAENDWRAIVLAAAGLERLGFALVHGKLVFEDQGFFTEILPREGFLPAGGQGIIALQVRNDDQTAKTIVGLVNDRETLLCLRAERGFLRLLQGDCNFPVGIWATMGNGKMKLRAQIFDEELAAPREGSIEGKFEDGERLAAQLLKQINGEQE